jgi:deazaflavin-dependent oxidoreductase (nitroreductase family)
VSRLAALYGRISPRLAHGPGSAAFTRAHAWQLRRGIGRRFVGVPVLVLRTTGRRSGAPRDAPLMFVRHGGGFAVSPANAASERTPAWWLNLQAHPRATVFLEGRAIEVAGREATAQERAETYPRLKAQYAGMEHYERVAGKEFPVVMLDPDR